MQAVMDLQRGGKPGHQSVNTRSILFIVSGAFPRLKDIVEKRRKQAQIGFAAPVDSGNGPAWQHEVTTADLIEYGMEAEFVGRLPVRVACDELTAADLRKILSESEGSVLRQYERAFLAFGIEAVFDEGALDRIAALAAEEGTGARGLLTVCERLLRDFKFDLPGSGVNSLRIDLDLIERPAERLAQLRASGEDERLRILRRSAQDFIERLGQAQGIVLQFAPGALELLVETAVARQKPVRELCAELFKDYEFGLRLVQRPAGGGPLVLPREAVEAPDKFLSDLVVRAYRQGSTDEPPAGSAS
jgi:hypothetical protein